MAVRVNVMIFRLLHPAVAFLYFAGVFAFIFICSHPVFMLTIMAGVFALAFFFVGVAQTLRTVKFPLVIGLVIGLLNPLFVHRGATILFYMGGNPVTLEAAIYGAYQGAMLAAVIILFTSFNRVIDQSAFLYLTARWLPRTAFVISMAINVFPRLKTRIATLAGVQRTKGVAADNKIIWGKGALRRVTDDVKTALLLFRAFTVRSLEEGMETAEVLRARDYGAQRRTSYRVYRFGARDVVCMILLFCLFTCFMWGYLRGATQYQFYPRLRPLLFSSAEWAVYAAFLLFMSMPFLVQIPSSLTHRRK